MEAENSGSDCSIWYIAVWSTLSWCRNIRIGVWCLWYVLNVAAEMEWIIIDTLGLLVLTCLFAIFINQSFPVFSLPKEKIDASLEKNIMNLAQSLCIELCMESP